MYLSDKQIAARYGITRECVWKWARELEGFPQPIRLSPGCTRWRIADLEAWEATKGGRTTGEAA